MKKNLFYAVLFVIAAIFASCESKEPTAVMPENMNDSVVITGYVRYITYDETMTATAPKIVDEGTEVNVLYGIEVNGQMNYITYKTKVDEDGFYHIALGCPAGKSISMVKVESNMFLESSTYAAYKNSDGTYEKKRTDAYYYGSASKANAAAHNAYGLDITMKPVDNTSKPGMNE